MISQRPERAREYAQPSDLDGYFQFSLPVGVTVFALNPEV